MLLRAVRKFFGFKASMDWSSPDARRSSMALHTICDLLAAWRHSDHIFVSFMILWSFGPAVSCIYLPLEPPTTHSATCSSSLMTTFLILTLSLVASFLWIFDWNWCLDMSVLFMTQSATGVFDWHTLDFAIKEFFDSYDLSHRFWLSTIAVIRIRLVTISVMQ